MLNPTITGASTHAQIADTDEAILRFAVTRQFRLPARVILGSQRIVGSIVQIAGAVQPVGDHRLADGPLVGNRFHRDPGINGIAAVEGGHALLEPLPRQ